MMEIEDKMSFSYDLDASINEDEHRVEFIMKRLRLAVKDDYYNTIIHNFNDEKVNQIHMITLIE